MPRAVAPDMRSRGYILLISHMRSHSTLLAHILGSHPEIDGYSELHRSYESQLELREMTRRIEEATGRRRRGRYALDKLLHNGGRIDAAILRRDDVKVVFLIRNPVDTIPSIVRTSRAVDLSLLEASPEAAVDYYVARLERINRYSELIGERAAFVESERLIDDTDAVLARLTRYLGLATPLEPTYERFPLSGQPGHGDPSANILAGRVLRDEERDRGGDEPVDIPAGPMRAAVAAYESLLPAMRLRHPA
ncbi:MAG: sulfotransferase [Betaproteobacteria bacterium]|nr:sulfotransferase [Betaproteobacteria bacterium]